MYTGIVQGNYPVKNVVNKPGLLTFEIELPQEMLTDIKIGASVASDGVCLTVSKINGQTLSFDAMEETLNKTTLGGLKEGSRVNIERSASMGDEIGGHIMAGHVTGMAEIVRIDRPENNHVITFKVPLEWMKYILQKGFVALDGCSLTVTDPNKTNGTFSVHLIPETLRQTSFGWKQVGDKVNVELDNRTQVIVDTVEAYLKDIK
ncbi:riboflavin synthase [Candidatus Uhrbacteria bacterium CG_4_10_14_0_2_um_filter_41_7]|uniref:Riboflavin synthase n=1 Tax=Candidatus Uhrbacteria bacterium CG_4_9_14_3_um_filter_41_35 TaxID=1975034 RepID=A0A2M7XGZ9_9BACT|nr:MAG: riboflavin synthase [Candidatus Uhrbacteria bacterium CG11_big_fil_rev_8_21_14_0_20_41_9]PIZ53174.1 MAG: riboflavin synthase [Candidatus Uhrbacteria bacterium CG_4_10_14_0_2_um_filter_41_7]PJA47132.1 MAG: riboflavin synthase [Candidatus Uhrbacteria bacterium CG_4_9_14_3_um_filter_41_35]